MRGTRLLAAALMCASLLPWGCVAGVTLALKNGTVSATSLKDVVTMDCLSTESREGLIFVDVSAFGGLPSGVIFKGHCPIPEFLLWYDDTKTAAWVNPVLTVSLLLDGAWKAELRQREQAELYEQLDKVLGSESFYSRERRPRDLTRSAATSSLPSRAGVKRAASPELSASDETGRDDALRATNVDDSEPQDSIPNKRRRPCGVPAGFVSADTGALNLTCAPIVSQDVQGAVYPAAIPLSTAERDYFSCRLDQLCAEADFGQPTSERNESVAVFDQEQGRADADEAAVPTSTQLYEPRVEDPRCFVAQFAPASSRTTCVNCIHAMGMPAAPMGQMRGLQYILPQPYSPSFMEGMLAEDVYDNIQAVFNISEKWKPVLMPILSTHEGLRVIREYDRRSGSETVFPQRTDVFSWTRYCSPETIKVIIVGQDPYHKAGQAHGLAFSVNMGQTVPPSLRNIKRAVQRCYPDAKISHHGNLSHWAEQGVLLINTVLTVKENEPGSHTSVGWTGIVRAVLRHFENGPSGMVYMLWGSHAQRIHTPRTARHLVLKYSHPSPLSRRPFADCRHFRIANDYLASMGKQPIDWSLP